jgi:ABC-type Fe3+-hydroxamate transport system substrate-binding protein
MPRLFTDMTGREVLLPRIPKRIVSLVPSQTELLHDLGLEDEVVGITKFCVHPEAWFRSKTRVGGTKQVHTGRVAALSPDLILANREENTKEQVEALSKISPVWVSDIRTLEDALMMISHVGCICDRRAKARDIAEAIQGGFDTLQPPPARKRVAYGIWQHPWMWAGRDTFISDLLRRIGYRNVLQDTRYPELSLADLALLRPDLVLLSSEPYPFREAHIAAVREAIPGADVRLVDGEMFSWYGSRLVHAVPYFKSLILAGV